MKNKPWGVLAREQAIARIAKSCTARRLAAKGQAETDTDKATSEVTETGK